MTPSRGSINMDFVHWQAPTNNDGRSKSTGAKENEKENSPSSVKDERKSSSGSAESENVPSLSHSNTVEEPEEQETSTRPRLTREQVYLLEKQFLAHPKPNGNTKKELAEATGLTLARVANWFQNRRAKAKQQRKQQEFEVMQSMQYANRARFGEPISPDLFYSSDFFLSEYDGAPQRNFINAEMFDRADGVFHGAYPIPQYSSPADASYASLNRSLSAAHAAVASGQFCDVTEDGSSMSPHTPYAFNPFAAPHHGFEQQFQIPEFSDYSSRNSSATWTPANLSETSYDYNTMQAPLSITDSQQSHTDSSTDHSATPSIDDGAEGVSFQNPFKVPSYPPQALHTPQFPAQDQATNSEISLVCHDIQEETLPHRGSCASDLVDHFGNVNIQSTNQETLWKQPNGALNIAARRKRPRPAPLGGAALRSHSFVGPMTVSPTAKSPFFATHSLRRIQSTGNNLNMIRGRIQKQSSGSAQRSPLNFQTFADAGAFDGPQLTPALPTPGSCSLAPPTPLSPLDMKRLQAESDRIATIEMYERQIALNSIPSSVAVENKLASPPSTPANGIGPFSVGQNNLYSPHTVQTPTFTQNYFDSGMIPSQFNTFPSQVASSQPAYVPQPMPNGQDMSSMINSSPYSMHEHMQEHGMINDNSSMIPSRQNDIVFYEPQQYPQQSTALPQTQQVQPKTYIFANQGPEDF